MPDFLELDTKFIFETSIKTEIQYKKHGVNEFKNSITPCFLIYLNKILSGSTNLL